MYRLPALSLFAAFLTVSASLAGAETLTLGSFATGTSSSSLGFSSETAMNFAGYTAFASPPAVATAPPLQNGVANTYALNPGSTWLAAMGNSAWVGSAPTAGPGGSDPAYGYYQFNTTFTATGAADYFGSISVMADDTVEVLLNGVVIVPFGSLGGDQHCADTPPNCTTIDTIALNGITLNGGVDSNTLTFIVEQAGMEGNSLDPSGVDFTATLTGDAPTPEPSSLILLGTGLVGAVGMFSRRSAQVAN